MVIGLIRVVVDIMKYRVTIELDEDGVFIAEVPALPGAFRREAHAAKL